MDITSSFRSCVLERKTQDKLIFGPHEEKLKSCVRRRCPFVEKCKEATRKITELKEFLVEHRKSYLSLEPEFLNGTGSSSSMSDKERDNVDSGAQSIVTTTSQLLRELKRDLYSTESGDQASEAHKAIVDLLEVYLKTVTKIFTEMKAIRVKWIVEVQKMAKFQSPAESSLESKEKDVSKIGSKAPEGTTFSPSTTSYSYEEESPLSEEEMQMFQMENDQLYNDLNSLNEEVRSIQSKVVKIAELQEVFTEKVLEQNEDIERISTTLVGTTENLKDANSQIRKAIQSNASFRIYVLFFILVMSFCLLFLDWYND